MSMHGALLCNRQWRADVCGSETADEDAAAGGVCCQPDQELEMEVDKALFSLYNQTPQSS